MRLKAHVLETAPYAAQWAAEKALDQAEAVRLLYVAIPGAKDYLLLGCYHKPVGRGPGSHAQQLWRAAGRDLARDRRTRATRR